ncbi:MAG: hypothetical protein JWM93_2813 [Frankiales bacterium]|nr:hypothetical protein [Frankiales bacterium]
MRRRPAAAVVRSSRLTADGQPTVSVCRGCCCGLVDDRPSAQAADSLAELRRTLRSHATVRVTDCLDVCDMADVVVVNPSPAARARGARAVWLARVLDAELVQDVVAWVHAGGPGRVERPAALDPHVFQPSRRVREAAEI